MKTFPPLLLLPLIFLILWLTLLGMVDPEPIKPPDQPVKELEIDPCLNPRPSKTPERVQLEETEPAR